jgi:hypothetical protein
VSVCRGDRLDCVVYSSVEQCISHFGWGEISFGSGFRVHGSQLTVSEFRLRNLQPRTAQPPPSAATNNLSRTFENILEATATTWWVFLRLSRLFSCWARKIPPAARAAPPPPAPPAPVPPAPGDGAQGVGSRVLLFSSKSEALDRNPSTPRSQPSKLQLPRPAARPALAPPARGVGVRCMGSWVEGVQWIPVFWSTSEAPNKTLLKNQEPDFQNANPLDLPRPQH